MANLAVAGSPKEMTLLERMLAAVGAVQGTSNRIEAMIGRAGQLDTTSADKVAGECPREPNLTAAVSDLEAAAQRLGRLADRLERVA